MSDAKRVIVVFTTIKTIAEVEELPEEGGARVRITRPPNYKLDATFFASQGQEPFSQEQENQLVEALLHATVEIAHKSIKKPDDVVNVSDIDSIVNNDNLN